MIVSKISPSLMCADFTNIKEVLNEFSKAGIEYLHIDVMDGVFVPNYMLSESVVKQFRKLTNIPFDYHLMIDKPESKIDWFDLQENDLMAIHYESTSHAQGILQKIKAKKAKAGIALNPSTPIESIKYLLEDLDFVVIMTVNPGFAGQKLILQTLKKIKDMRKYLDDNGYQHIMIEVDGNVSFENAVKMRKMGADIFVAGTSSVFKKDLTIKEGIAELRKAINGE